MATASWACPACTFINVASATACHICFTGRLISLTMAATTNTMIMTPSLLTQKWRSHGKARATVTVFSQPTLHPFSNYVRHAAVTMDIPHCCDALALANSGRSTRISFTFAEKAIMACKAALFRDYTTFDKILGCNDSRSAKRLGRQVINFDQQAWNAHQCEIVRQVTIAKLAWPNFHAALLQTRTNIIAECTNGDWVWGTALDAFDGNVSYPGRWKGSNILGWSLMEARDEATRTLQQQQHQQPNFAAVPSAPPINLIENFSSAPPAPVARSKPSKDEKLNPNSINHLASQYSFGPNAFGALQRSTPQTTSNEDLSYSVRDIIEASYPQATNMYGERNRKLVTRMLTDIYNQGLFMHGSADSVVNRTIVPAFRHVISEMNKLNANEEKRISMARNLAEACQDCQQVQARVILRLFGDLTSQNQTFESQLKYSLVQPKEAALHSLISKYHSPTCDLDHTQVNSANQRAHLVSGYVSLIGNSFGLDGVDAANSDRFLYDSLGVIRNIHITPLLQEAETKTAEQKDDIIQKLIQNKMDVAASKYERVHSRLTTTHKREISMYVHKFMDKDVIPCLYPGLPPPFTESEFQAVSSEQQKAKKHKSGIAGFLLGRNKQSNTTLDDETLKLFLMNELSQNLCVKEWLAGLIGDINNQATDADRIIDNNCIFDWASANMDGDFKHCIFYDEDRIEEFSDLDPKQPTDDNQYKPFLSPAVLVKMLVKAGMLKRK